MINPEGKLKKIIAFTCFLSLLLAGCAPSAEEIQLAIAQTQTASAPTFTPTPLVTATPETTATLDPGSMWFTLEQSVNNLITGVDGVRVVHWVKLNDQTIDIDLQTEWQAAENQPEVAFAIIKQLSGFCSNTMSDQIKSYTGVADPSIRITTTSVDERYEFTSLTTFEQCVSVAFGDLNYKDWQTAAQVTQLK